MAGITLETAQKHLDVWLEAEMTVATGQSYTIGFWRFCSESCAAAPHRSGLSLEKCFPLSSR